MKTLRLISLLALLPLLAQAQVQRIVTTSTNDPSKQKISGIVISNNVIITSQSVTSGAVNGTNAGPGVAGQVVKLNASGVVDSTLLQAQSWQTNVVMQAFVVATTTAWTNLVTVTPSKTNGQIMVSCGATYFDGDGGGIGIGAIQLLSVSGGVTNTLATTGVGATASSGIVGASLASTYSLTNASTTFILRGYNSSVSGADGWIGTNAAAISTSIINATSMNILGF